MTEMTAPPVTIIQPTSGIASLQLRAVWQYRELLGFLAWRDVKVRYKQTALRRSTERTSAYAI